MHVSGQSLSSSLLQITLSQLLMGRQSTFTLVSSRVGGNGQCCSSQYMLPRVAQQNAGRGTAARRERHFTTKMSHCLQQMLKTHAWPKICIQMARFYETLHVGIMSHTSAVAVVSTLTLPGRTILVTNGGLRTLCAELRTCEAWRRRVLQIPSLSRRLGRVE